MVTNKLYHADCINLFSTTSNVNKRIVKKSGLTITISSNSPSQSALNDFRDKLFLLCQGYIDKQHNTSYNRTKEA